MLITKKHYLLSIILSFVLICSLTVTSSASDIDIEMTDVDNTIAPYYVNVGNTNNNLHFSSGKVTISFTVTGYSGTSFEKGTVKLYRDTGSGYKLYKSWSDISSSTRVLSFYNNTVSAVSGYSYKAILTIDSVNGNTTETITINTPSATYSAS